MSFVLALQAQEALYAAAAHSKDDSKVHLSDEERTTDSDAISEVDDDAVLCTFNFELHDLQLNTS